MQQRIRILLVEDNPGDQYMIRELLTEATAFSFDLSCADRLSEAIACLGRSGFDLVLLDLSLPDATGLDSFSALHGVATGVPVIVLTGLDDDAAALESVNRGAQDYLVKEKVDAETLARAIRYAIERNRAIARLRDSLERERGIAEELRESERKFRSLVKNIPGAVYRSGVEHPWRWVYVSESVADLGGCQATELMGGGRHWASLVHPEDVEPLARALQVAVERREPYRLTYRVLHVRKGMRWVFDQGQAVYGEDGTPRFLEGVVCDITERKRLEEAEERLRLFEYRERIAMELHDGAIQSLFALGSRLQAMLRVEEPATTKARLVESIDEVDQIMQDLRGFVTDLRPNVLGGVELERALRAVARTFEVSDTRVAVDVDARAASRLACFASSEHVVKAASEALSNAVRHSGTNEIDLVLAMDGSAAVLEVRDQGKGFRPQTRALGQGLANLKARAEALGAELRVDSAPGAGAKVSLRIPLPGNRPHLSVQPL